MSRGKVGRNDICPCGSGKKYKKCCGTSTPPTRNVEIIAFRSRRVIVTIQSGAKRYKVIQVFFGNDGSLFVNFPYFHKRIGLLAATEIPAGHATSQVNLEIGGRVTSHLVKYSHHPDGRAHFSQDGKVRTEVKRKSLALDSHSGHLFSVLIQGLSAFDTADEGRDRGTSPQRTTITFEMPSGADLEAIKLVGRWYSLAALPLSGAQGDKIGPHLQAKNPDGQIQNGYLIASPLGNAKHVLLLTCEAIPRLGADAEILGFYGGFDPPEVMTDVNRNAGFLAFIYPADNAEDLKQRIGSVDYLRE